MKILNRERGIFTPRNAKLRLTTGVFAVVVIIILSGCMTLGNPSQTETPRSAPDCSTVSYDGAGTDSNPYNVSNVDQLQCIESQDLNANYVVVSDINGSGTESWNDGGGFEPIGEFDEGQRAVTAKFNGSFDGQDHDVTDLTINRKVRNAVGLFGTVGSAGKVTNVSVVDTDVYGNDKVGGLAGVNAGIISESSVSGSVEGSFNVGGLVGRNLGTVSDSHATGSIGGNTGIGGLVGRNGEAFGEATVRESYSTGEVIGNFNVGGLVGDNEKGTISESYAAGSVDGTEEVGGLAGKNFQSMVIGSYATGSVNGSNRVGGLVGSTAFGTVSESYASGSVNGSKPVNLYKLKDDAYPNVPQEVNGSKYGGLVGFKINNQSTVNRSYWDVQTTGQTTSAINGTGLTTAEMTGDDATDNMRGFDFTSTWETVPGGYPVLWWQKEGDRTGE